MAKTYKFKIINIKLKYTIFKCHPLVLVVTLISQHLTLLKKKLGLETTGPIIAGCYAVR